MIRVVYTVLLLTFIGFETIHLRAQNTSGSASANLASSPAAVSSTSSKPAAVTDDASPPMQGSDFVIDGVRYARVLYLEGNVWIRPPSATFHRLTEDEPIPGQSIIYTGFNGVLDFATGPGMAVRMIPGTLVVVDQLPQSSPPPPAPKPVTAAPTTIEPPSAAKTVQVLPMTSAPAAEASEVTVRKGTIFSALGRDDGQPIDFKVRTPEGVAGAKGTMFSTTAAEGQTEVSMLHGTVNFQTPDQQTAQIPAGQSQQISGSAGNKYQFARQRSLSPANSESFFNHAGGLLEHASGYGAVRRGLGLDIARTLQARGFKLSTALMQRFQNAGKIRFRNRPIFNRMRMTHPAGAGPSGVRATPAPAPAYRPVTPAEKKAETKPAQGSASGQDDIERRRRRGE